MFDYNELLDVKTKKQLLFEAIEEQENRLKELIDDAEDSKDMGIMEEWYVALRDIVAKHESKPQKEN